MKIITLIYADTTVSFNDLKKMNPKKILQQAGGNLVAILNQNKPEACLLSANYYEKILEILDDIVLGELVKNRLKGKTVRVNLDDL